MSFDHLSNRTVVSRRTALRTGATALLLGGTGLVGSVGARGNEPEDSEHGWGRATIHDQEIDATDLGGGEVSVRVKRAEFESGGYMSIHDARRRLQLDGSVEDPINESFVGLTEYLESGSYHDLEVPLYPDHPLLPGDPRMDETDLRDDVEEDAVYVNDDIEVMAASQPLLAIPHVDDSDPAESFTVGIDGAYSHGKRTLNQLPPVHDIATVYFADDTREQRQEAKAEERQARREWNGGGPPGQ